jgi:hypothetical protein
MQASDYPQPGQLSSPLEKDLPVLPTLGPATAAAAAAATAADSAPTAAVAAVLVGGHRGSQALQLAFALGDFHCGHGLTPLHLSSKVHGPFLGGRGALQGLPFPFLLPVARMGPADGPGMEDMHSHRSENF